jgi:chromosome segregation ATPase
MTSVAGTAKGSEDSSLALQLKREIYELHERTAELEGELAEQIERGRRATLELSAARRDLEVKEAYNLMLERIAGERAGHIETLQRQLTVVGDETVALKKRTHRQRRRAIEAQRQVARLRVSLDEAKTQLEVERSRTSHRLADEVATKLQRHRMVHALARPVVRRIARGMESPRDP